MGNKIKQVGLIIGATILVYLFLLAIWPVVVDMSSTANATITASSNFTDYPGTQAVLVGAPLWLFLVPAGISTAVIVLVLRSKGG